MSEYTANDIQILEGLEAVRKRPAMYIGDTGTSGLHHLVYEIVDNSIDEANGGYCNKIDIVINLDNSVKVSDNGRGIPVGIHPKTGRSALEVVMSTLHAGGKFDSKVYKASGGLHGVGLSVVNGLSEHLDAYVGRDGKKYHIRCEKGKVVTEVKVIGESESTGTTIVFKPDSTIFTETVFTFEILANRLRELAFLNKGLSITLEDLRNNTREEYKYEGGIVSFVEYINKSKEALHKPIYFYGTQGNGDITVEIALQYTATFSDNIYTFANNINTHEGGFHLVGFKAGLTRCINDYAFENKLLKDKEERLSGDDIKEGLTAIISVKIINPQFEGQTKTKLGNSEVKGVVESAVFDKLKMYLEENPHEARRVIEKCQSAAQARMAAQKAKDLIRRKNFLEGSLLPGKLADCIEEDPKKTELFIVEGDSAGGCFSGDTKVALVDGRNLSFRELVKENAQRKKNYCYTVNDDGTIGIGQIKNPRMTRKNAEVIKLVLDNGEEVICTDDHLFMMKDGNYLEARNLKTELSIMPLYRKISEIGGRITIAGYEMVWDPKKNKWIFTHVLSDKYNLEMKKYEPIEKAHKHHIDFNRLNNNPDNIARLSKTDHMNLHARMAEKTIRRKDVMLKSKLARLTPAYRDKVSKIMSTDKMLLMLRKRAKNQWENVDYKNFMGQKWKTFYDSNKEYRSEVLERLNRLQQEYWSGNQNKLLQSDKTRKYFKAHPEAKTALSQIAKQQWSDSKLLTWRSNKTKEQWTSEFRMKRKAAYDVTYYNSSLAFMKKVLEQYGTLEKYDAVRIESKDKNLLKKKTVAVRFFNGNEDALLEAVANYNHKIMETIKINEKMDVYDLEVDGTHNFALACGVFVHNSAKQGRDRKIQAILPLRGKILNVEKAQINRVLASEEIRNLITAMGTNFGIDFSLDRLRYHKIVIMTDADVDGAHIRTLLLTLFFRHMKPLIEMGHIYAAMPPLFKVKKGKVEKYVYNEDQLKQALLEMGADCGVQRYKGLGEMNPQQLWETTMDPEKRSLIQITIQDAIKADELFTILMGEVVEPRKAFIEAHAKDVKNLDV